MQITQYVVYFCLFLTSQPSTGKVKMFFLYTLKGENDTEILEIRPANEILTQLKQKRLSNVGTAIRIVNMRHGMVSKCFFITLFYYLM